MERQILDVPCGFLQLSKEGNILSANPMLLKLLHYEMDQLIGSHVTKILTNAAKLYFQLYFVPSIHVKQHVNEMYLNLATSTGEEIPILLNSSLITEEDNSRINCVMVVVKERNEYENQLLTARKDADKALAEKEKVNAQLSKAIEELESKQEKLLELMKQNEHYKKETEKDLELARKIQATSLTNPIINEDIHIDSFYKASSELSGDMYGFYQIDKHRYGIILLDVMGHGISSALVTMSLQSLFHRLITRGYTAESVMKELDNHLHDLFRNNDEAWHYCTAIYLSIDTEKQLIEYINAGHPPAIWQNPEGDQHELWKTAPPIGAIEGLSFKPTSFSYTAGGRLLLYTDGVNEDFDEDNYLSTQFKKHKNLPVDELREKIIQAIEDNESIGGNDDQCFILVNLF